MEYPDECQRVIALHQEEPMDHAIIVGQLMQRCKRFIEAVCLPQNYCGPMGFRRLAGDVGDGAPPRSQALERGRSGPWGRLLTPPEDAYSACSGARVRVRYR